jgi:hypothetical protein
LTDPVFVETTEPVETLVRFEPHLLKRPWLNDMQALLDHDPSDQTLSEPAQETLTWTRKSVAAWCEAVSTWMVGVWNDAEVQAELPAFPDAWQERDTDLDFAGYSDDAPRQSDMALISPNELELFRTAQRLVDERKPRTGEAPREDGSP